LGLVVDEKVKAVEAASSGAGRDSGKRTLAASGAADAGSSGLGLASRHMLPTGLEMNGNKRRMYDVESVEQFLKFLSSRGQLGKDEIVDLAQQGYATAGQFGGHQQSTVTGATGHGSLAVDLFEENGVAKFRISSILQLAAEVTAERVLMMKDPGALEDLMANQLVDVLRDVFGSKWSRMCQNLRKLTSEAPCLRVDFPAVSGS